VHPDDAFTGPEMKAYTTGEFAREISYQLRHVVDPRFGSIHDERFTAQDHQWEEAYHDRTGIPLAHYRYRLQELRQIPARPFTEIRSATNAEVEAWDKQNPQSASRKRQHSGHCHGFFWREHVRTEEANSAAGDGVYGLPPW
jgi:hypothetical protein